MRVGKEVTVFVNVNVNADDVLDEMSREQIMAELGRRVELDFNDPVAQIIFMLEKLGTEEYKEIYDHILGSYHYDILKKVEWVD